MLFTSWILLLIFFKLLCLETYGVKADVLCDPDIPSRPQSDIVDNDAALPLRDAQVTNCPSGEYLNGYKCSSCDEETFRTKQMAAQDRYSMCHKCQEPGSNEIVTEPCTKIRDAVIMCEDGFYRHQTLGKPCKSECKVCATCGVGKYMFFSHTARQCNGYNDSLCCQENMIELNGNCAARTTMTTQATLTSAVTVAAGRKANEPYKQQSASEGIPKKPSVLPLVACLFIVAYRMC